MAERWVSGFWIDERWRFTAEQRQRVQTALGLDAHPFRKILPRLIDAAQLYRAYAENEGTRPTPSRAGPQLARVSDTASALEEALTRLDDSAHEHLEERFAGRVDLLAFRRQLAALASAAGSFDGRGRPRKDALGIFVNQLALVWESVHDWPRRSVREPTGKEAGPFRRFVEAMLAAVDPGQECPDGIIRQVLRGRRPMEKNRGRQC